MSPYAITTPANTSQISAQHKRKTVVQEEKQVIVHCHYTCSNPYGMYIRIWPTTFLVAKDVHHRSTLVHVENIPYVPQWMPVTPGTSSQFTLIFTGLPKDCAVFDLVEEIPQSGGFLVENIRRNELDVYEVDIDD